MRRVSVLLYGLPPDGCVGYSIEAPDEPSHAQPAEILNFFSGAVNSGD